MRLTLGVVLLAVEVSCGGASAPRAPAVAPPPPVKPEPAPTGPVIPDTPAGVTFRAWFDAFNGGDEAGIGAFVSQYKPAMPLEMWLQFRAGTGGFELVAMEPGDRLSLRFVVKEHASPTEAVGWLKVKDADPPEIESFTILGIPPGMTADEMDIHIDDATRTRVVEAAAARLIELYVYAEVAEKLTKAIRDHQASGAYDSIDEGPAFAERLTQDLQAVSHDKHLGVMWDPMVLPESETEPTADDKARMREQLTESNCGFAKAESLDGNVGYIKFDFFGDVEVCGPIATETFGSLGDVDALIFDLRYNGGGHPAMVAFVSSYLFVKRTHLNDLYERATDKTTEYWTDPDVPGAKFATQPVYVLTSSYTFSGAEEFAYSLKNLHRATIVGETTGGGAHPTMRERLDDHFSISVPSARAVNPITKTNWEGTGVEPDVKVAADQALETATKLVADARAKQAKPKTTKPSKRKKGKK